MFAVLTRTLIVYIILLVAMRITGKRQIGELQLSELITALLLSEIAAMPISDLSIPVLYSILPTALIICLEIAVPCLANSFPFFSKIIEGKPNMIICRGVLIPRELERARMGIDELICELRLKNITDINDVEYAILEQNGKLSVIPKESCRPVTTEDLGIKSKSRGFAHPIILGGSVCTYNLRFIGKNEKWLMKKLGGDVPENILLMTVDDCDNINIIKKETKK